jgi:hypothetical protein
VFAACCYPLRKRNCGRRTSLGTDANGFLDAGRLTSTTDPERRIARWEHEAVLENVQDRLDRNPGKMTLRRQTAEHPFGTMKAWMGWTHFLTRTLPKVATEMALNVLAYNMKRAMRILGVSALLKAMQA